jgi:hypothetical protein
MKKIYMRQNPTTNVQHPTFSDVGGWRRWLFDVGCWMLDVSISRLAILLLLASGGFALAQSNSVPGASDYDRFSHFVADRNIFDPNRVPHSYSPTRRFTRTTRRSTGTPGIMLVGTMSYEKGMFAFFNGNNADLKKALQVGEKVADYTVTTIEPSMVKLECSDRKESFELKIGESLRQENGKWVFSGGSDLPAAGTSSSSASSPSEDSSKSAAAPSAGEPNDVLKRLMQLREKENQ